MINRYGYGIPLDTLSKEDVESMEKALTVKPLVMGDYETEIVEFPVYRKSERNIYVPRYYGLSKYGQATNSIKDGKLIVPAGPAGSAGPKDLFSGSLKDHQVDFCNDILTELNTNGSCVACSKTGSGKCHGIDTPILMNDGQIKKVQDIQIGDKLMGPDSEPRTVLSLGTGYDTMYSIKLNGDESPYIFNSEHILCLVKKHVLTPEAQRAQVYRLSQYPPTETPTELLQIGPEINMTIKEYLTLSDEEKSTLYLYKTSVEFTHRKIVMVQEAPSAYEAGRAYLSDAFEYIPSIYKINSAKIRTDFIIGLLNNHRCIYTMHRQKKEDIVFIAQSLGLLALVNPLVTTEICTVYEIEIVGIPFKVPLIFKFTVTELPVDRYYGFELDKDHKYLMGNFMVTHNTTMALWTVAQLRRKTLILVHKSFLMDQWVERINQFLPTTSVGIIKQDLCEIDKDVVVGMIQTIISRGYDQSLFKNFHLTIFDEVHHMGAEVFSRLFYKIGTKLTLGLSANIKRADGLTKVIEWFLGRVLVNTVKSDVESPIVRFVEAEYGTVIKPKYNHKAQLNNQDLINQLVADPVRTALVIGIVADLFKEGRQILVLSARRGHCELISKGLHKMGINNGLYLGAMSQQELSYSNDKSVIIGTYNMVAEAYDNPKLDTLVMATGIRTVEQSVGRVLRKKNTFRPLIVDVTDMQYTGHQTRARRQFYKKSGFEYEGQKGQNGKKGSVFSKGFEDNEMSDLLRNSDECMF